MTPYLTFIDCTSNVRFGSKADICSAKRNVRFTPESGHVQCNSACPLSANSGHRRLFDHLVGTLLEEQRNIEAERLGGLGVDGHLIFDRQLDGKLRRLCATENEIDVRC